MEPPAIWAHFESLKDLRVERTRRHKLQDILVTGEESSFERRYYLTRLTPDAAVIGERIRGHWGDRERTLLGSGHGLRRRPLSNSP
ncbi:MAG: hypothetical protein JW940_39475 [Polyangiaceae bacterium]|nr:hypothetical protein [Polyangiaceae bacterium]